MFQDLTYSESAVTFQLLCVLNNIKWRNNYETRYISIVMIGAVAAAVVVAVVVDNNDDNNNRKNNNTFIAMGNVWKERQLHAFRVTQSVQSPSNTLKRLSHKYGRIIWIKLQHNFTWINKQDILIKCNVWSAWKYLIILTFAMPNARIGHKMICIKKNKVALLYAIIKSLWGKNSMGLM